MLEEFRTGCIKDCHEAALDAIFGSMEHPVQGLLVSLGFEHGLALSGDCDCICDALVLHLSWGTVQVCPMEVDCYVWLLFVCTEGHGLAGRSISGAGHMIIEHHPHIGGCHGCGLQGVIQKLHLGYEILSLCCRCCIPSVCEWSCCFVMPVGCSPSIWSLYMAYPMCSKCSLWH